MDVELCITHAASSESGAVDPILLDEVIFTVDGEVGFLSVERRREGTSKCPGTLNREIISIVKALFVGIWIAVVRKCANTSQVRLVLTLSMFSAPEESYQALRAGSDAASPICVGLHVHEWAYSSRRSTSISLTYLVH